MIEHKVVAAGHKGLGAWMVCSCGYEANGWTMAGASVLMTPHIDQGNAASNDSEAPGGDS